MRIRYKSVIVDGKMLITVPKLVQKNTISRSRVVSLCYCPALGKQLTEFAARKLIEAGHARFVIPDDIDTSPVTPRTPLPKANLPVSGTQKAPPPSECDVCGQKSASSTCRECMELYDQPLYAPKMRVCGVCKEPTPNYWRCSKCQLDLSGVDSRYIYGNPRGAPGAEESTSDMSELVLPDCE